MIEEERREWVKTIVEAKNNVSRIRKILYILGDQEYEDEMNQKVLSEALVLLKNIRVKDGEKKVEMLQVWKTDAPSIDAK